jgi:translocation and assembly module TamA
MGAATSSNVFQIQGIKGKALENVQHRLSEFHQNKAFEHASENLLREQVELALYPYGFFKPEIIMHERAHHAWSIIIHPGPQMRITRLDFTLAGEGHLNSVIQKTYQESPLHPGIAFNSETYEAAKTALLNSAEQEGYLHATFEKAEVRIDKERYTATIMLHFNTGPRFYFGDIKFPTQQSLSPDLLYRYIPFKYDQPYSTEQVATLTNNLLASGYFRAVDVRPEENNTNHVPLALNLQPVDRINYTLGAGYGTDTGIRGRAGVHVNPVNAFGHQFNAIAQGSLTQNALQAQYVIPGADPIHDHYSLNGGFTNLNYVSGTSNAFLFSVAEQHVQDSYQRNLSLNALHERFHYIGYPNNEVNSLYPKAVFTWRHVTDELFSPSGYNITINGLAATDAILSDISFAQASIDAKAALTIDILRTRLYLHGMQGVSAVHDVYKLPLSLALLLGGAENMKGYSFNAIGPGKYLTYGGLEIQKETFDTWYLLGFIDAGHVYSPNPQSFQYDVGAGLMWRSPVGPIKLAAALPTNEKFHGRGLRFVANMGPDL